MIVYNILALTSLLMFLFNAYLRSHKINAEKVFVFFMFVFLFIIAALRSIDVGADTYMYVNFFEIISNNSFYDLSNGLVQLGVEQIETGYLFFNKLVSLLSVNSQMIIIANSFLVTMLLYKTLKIESKSVLMSTYLFITLGFFQTSMNTVRSMIAVLIAYIAISVYKRHRIKSLIIFGIAVSFHTSVFLLVIIPICDLIPLEKKYLKYYMLGIVMLYVVFAQIVSLLTLIVPDNYLFYLDRADEGLLDKLIPLIVHIIILGICLFFSNNKKSCIKNQSKIWYFLLFEILFYMISLRLVMFTRVAYLFSTYTIISVPNMLVNIKSMRNKRYATALIIIISLIQFLIRIQINNIGNTIPYDSIL